MPDSHRKVYEINVTGNDVENIKPNAYLINCIKMKCLSNSLEDSTIPSSSSKDIEYSNKSPQYLCEYLDVQDFLKEVWSRLN